MYNKIEKMNLIHHVKIFQIVKNHGIDYSENRNGIFFNMNLFNDDCINDINEYVLKNSGKFIRSKIIYLYGSEIGVRNQKLIELASAA